MQTKQVIIIRRDLKMRQGKAIAQGSHASMAFLTKGMNWFICTGIHFETESFPDNQAEVIIHWLKNSFRKIVVYVNSEEELCEIYQKAIDKGLISTIIEDNGATEFRGVKTKTCVAIGPAKEEDFEGITNHLPLY